MKVTQKQLDDLLALNAIDQGLIAKESQLSKIRSSAEVTAAQKKLSQVSQAFLEASKREEAIALELDRNNSDLRIVEQRRKLDENRLIEAKNTKDVTGLQSELATLKRRQDELEEVSLDLMERQQVVAEEIEKLRAERESIRAAAAELQSKVESEMMKLQSAIELAKQDRARTVELLSNDLVALYERKLSRAIPVGRLNGPQCGACQMTVASAAYSSLMALPLDELIECPECSAILVRS